MNTKEALFYKNIGNTTLQCCLCPQYCSIKDGNAGFCGVRRNYGGKLYAINYGEISSLALDPIEKKPLYRYHSGEYILSVGTVGCNLSCQFCQNWNISRDVSAPTDSIRPEDLIARAMDLNSFGIAYTYNEPFIWYEFVYEAAQLAVESGLENVLVTNGFVNKEPLEKILPLISAMNIDIKSIEDDFYMNTCSGRVAPVLEAVKLAARSTHVELTNLVIPTLNDKDENFEKLTDWIYDNLGKDVPLHFSRYFPSYKMTLPPTPESTLIRAKEIAERKLRYVYLGNV